MKLTGKTEQLVKATTLAEYLAVHRATIYKLAKSGVIPFVYVGAAMRFDPQAVMEALETNLSDVPSQTTTI